MRRNAGALRSTTGTSGGDDTAEAEAITVNGSEAFASLTTGAAVWEAEDAIDGKDNEAAVASMRTGAADSEAEAVDVAVAPLISNSIAASDTEAAAVESDTEATELEVEAELEEELLEDIMVQQTLQLN